MISKFNTFIHYYFLLLYLRTPWSFLVLLSFLIYKQFILVSVLAEEIDSEVSNTSETRFSRNQLLLIAISIYGIYFIITYFLGDTSSMPSSVTVLNPIDDAIHIQASVPSSMSSSATTDVLVINDSFPIKAVEIIPSDPASNSREVARAMLDDLYSSIG